MKYASEAQNTATPLHKTTTESQLDMLYSLTLTFSDVVKGPVDSIETSKHKCK